MKVAYYVGGYDSADIVFAESEEDAAEIAGSNLIDAEKVERSPQYDRFVQYGVVPASVLASDGWRFECWECSRATDDEEEEDEEGNPILPVDIQFLGNRGVFCCKGCLDSYVARKERDKQLKEAAIAEFQSKFPGATSIEVFTKGKERFSILFKFPGGIHFGNWTQGETFLTIQERDIEAFELWTGKKAKVLEEARS